MYEICCLFLESLYPLNTTFSDSVFIHPWLAELLHNTKKCYLKKYLWAMSLAFPNISLSVSLRSWRVRKEHHSETNEDPARQRLQCRVSVKWGGKPCTMWFIHIHIHICVYTSMYLWKVWSLGWIWNPYRNPLS